MTKKTEEKTDKEHKLSTAKRQLSKDTYRTAKWLWQCDGSKGNIKDYRTKAT